MSEAMGDDGGRGTHERWDVRSLAATYRASHRLSAHRHGWAQLVYARTGVMHVTVEDRVWLVPPTRAAWIPAGLPHAIEFRGEVALRTLYLAPARAAQVVRPDEAGGAARACTLEVSPLLSALVLHILAIGMLDPAVPRHDRLAGLLTDLLADAPALDLALPLPADARARRFTEALRADPASHHDLDALAARCGASLRTIQRHVQQQTGMPLDAWRQKARLTHSIALLAAGSSVAAAAQASGYESSSAFAAAFRRQFGVPPGRFTARA
jgi:AraC-like DNA-binding protein